jgi:glycosyltransferase involved in cell wall biosynthesis
MSSSNNLPTTTIVVCVFNAEKFLRQSIESLLAQTYKNINILILNDGSTDRSLEIIKEYATNFEHVDYISDGVNRGTAARRQQGLDTVTTELMSFFDADDIAETELIKSQVNRISHDDKCIAVGVYSYYIGLDSSKILGTQRVGEIDKKSFLERCKAGKLIYLTPYTLFRREFALKAGGYRQNGFEKFKSVRAQDISEDVDMWTRMSDFYEDGFHMITIDKPLVKYRKMSDSLSEKNVILMSQKLRWIKFCVQNRRNGEREIDFYTYLEQQKLFDKWHNYITDRGDVLYKKMTLKVLGKNYVMALFFGVFATLLNPKLVYKKFSIISKKNN